MADINNFLALMLQLSVPIGDTKCLKTVYVRV